MTSHELSKPRRIELILRQIDALPTLPAVATRLLTLTADRNAQAREVTQLIQSDPALTARILSLCRTAEKGVRSDILTIDRAVVLLGFSAIRNAVLAVKVFEIFHGTMDGDLDAPEGATARTDAQGLSRQGFWLHSLAVALAAEAIAKAHRQRDLPADEAFVCGLLHDLGKLALDHVLPRSYARVVELAELHRGDIAEYERKILGLDHHTAGKRLVEQWQLPLRLQDAIWLHGAPAGTLPQLEHRRMISLIQLADAVVRERHIGFSGNHRPADVDALAMGMGLSPEKVQQATANLFQVLEARGQALGIHDEPSHELALQSIQQANAALGSANTALERRSRLATAQGRVLESIGRFHSAADPGGSVQDALDRVAASARDFWGDGFYAMLHPLPSGESAKAFPWLVAQYTSNGEALDARYLSAPPGAPSVRQLAQLSGEAMDLAGFLPWVDSQLLRSADTRPLQVRALPCGWGTVALLVHEAPDASKGSTPAALLEPLMATWGSAVASAVQHTGARRLSEQLNTANAELAAAQHKLADTASLARLGEMAAGAAHEMNNPLAVIGGRSQLLSMTLPAGSEAQKSAQLIFRESHRLSDLITCLRMFADPPQAQRQMVDMPALLERVVKKVRHAATRRPVIYRIELQPCETMPLLPVDGDQLDRAVTELLFNAVQANPRSAVVVSLRCEDGRGMPLQSFDPAEALGGRLLINVTDDGDGMDSHTLEHALDPFFSAKPAGRQMGMGLARAQQLAAAHGGGVVLHSSPQRGTVATLEIPLDWSASTDDVADEPVTATSVVADQRVA